MAGALRRREVSCLVDARHVFHDMHMLSCHHMGKRLPAEHDKDSAASA